MIEAIVLAVIIAVVVGALLTFLLGPIIKSIPAPIAQIVGDFFVKFGWAIGVLCGLAYFFLGGSFLGIKR